MVMTKVGAAAPSGSQATTTFQLGTYNPITDTFTQLLDLNDGVTYFLKPGKGGGANPKFDQKSTAIRADNVRAHGSNVVKDHLDNITCTAVFTIKSTTPQAVSDAWNAVVKIVKGQQGAQNNGALCLRFAWPQSSAYSYLDIQYAAVTTPIGAPLEIQAKASTGLTIALEGGYGWRWDRLTYQNLAWNPGFEAPSGPGVQVFADTFATVNAYTVQSGGTPTTGPANTWADIVYANTNASLLRWHRLGEAAGTSVYDISGNGQTATASATGITYGVTGLVSGSTDTCYTFASASTGKVTGVAAGLPTGNNPISLLVGFKFAANPASNGVMLYYGGSSSKTGISLYLDTAGKLNCDALASAGQIISGSAMATATAHLAIVTWDGATLKLYADGSSVGTPTTPGALTMAATNFVIADNLSTAYFNGQLDEAIVVAGALSSSQVTALWNAYHSGATGTLAGAISFPASSRVSFGSPNWGAVNTWAVRFRWDKNMTEQDFFLHYTDANNKLYAFVKPTQLALAHTVGGVFTQFATAAVAMQHEALYWLQITQFPAVSTAAPYLQVVLAYDSNGSPGATISTIAGQAVSSTVAVTGKPQIAPTGAALVLCGLSTLGHTVSLFGPGAWGFSPLRNSASCIASAAWETVVSNCYLLGPQLSFGAARIDLGPTGTFDCQWFQYHAEATNLSPTGLFALPINVTPATVPISAWVKTSGLGVACATQLWAYEYDSSGTYLRSSTIATLTGNSAGGVYQQLSGTLTTGTSTAYLGLAVRVVDTNSGASANGIVWIDNVLAWDQTFTATQNMPYCELRFPQGPAQLMVSGLQGTIESPSQVALGTFLTSLAGGHAVQYTMGRRALAHASTLLVTPYGNPNISGSILPVLDATAYGGVYQTGALGGGYGVTGYANLQAPYTVQGVYHLFDRVKCSQATLANVTTLVSAQVGSNFPTNVSNQDVVVGGAFALFTAANTWLLMDHGKVNEPLGALPTATDPIYLYQQVQTAYADSTGGGSTIFLGANALIPIDGSIVMAQLINGSGNLFSVTNAWLWAYFDGLSCVASGAPAVGFTADSVPIAQPSRIIVGNGITTGSSLGINPSADPFVLVDPNVSTSTASGVNQFCGFATDTSSGAVQPFAMDLTYSPISLYPR